MNLICLDEARTILSDLIAIPSVNPMDRPYKATEPVERKVSDYIEGIFRPYGISATRHSCSPMHESLLVAIPGKTEGPCTLLEAHMDTVPADDWMDTAFTPRIAGQIIYGRGACDDKGPLTSMILAVRSILEDGMVPPHPVAFLAAGDEEYAQKGIKHFASLSHPLCRAVIGEATDLVPIVQHNGTVRWDITVHGRSAHTSRPELGCNAILGAMEVIRALHEHQQMLRAKLSNPLVYGPTLTVTMIRGGRTRNAVPDECTLAVDFRVTPGLNLVEARQGVIDALKSVPYTISHSETQLMTPPLSTSPSDPFCTSVLEICRRVTGRSDLQLSGAPWGTDASWVADRAPTVVLGPGTTETAHAVNECTDLAQVVDGAVVYRDIIMNEV